MYEEDPSYLRATRARDWSRRKTRLIWQTFGCMIVLVDTSVWIRFLSNRAPYAAELDELLGRDEVSGHDFVYGELLVGDSGGRRLLLADYAQMHHAPIVPHEDVVTFVVGSSVREVGSVVSDVQFPGHCRQGPIDRPQFQSSS